MIKISPAKISDAPKIRKLETEIWREEVTNKYDAPMFIRFGYCFVAKDGKKIVGAICSYLTKNNEVYVCDWVVDKDYRRQNVGSRLYKKIIAVARNKNIVAFVDTKNKSSLAAHLKLGFKIVGRIKDVEKSVGDYLLRLKSAKLK